MKTKRSLLHASPPCFEFIFLGCSTTYEGYTLPGWWPRDSSPVVTEREWHVAAERMTTKSIHTATQKDKSERDVNLM
jgi:hypothetical protein